jgi:signal transduction histidine kinase
VLPADDIVMRPHSSQDTGQIGPRSQPAPREGSAGAESRRDHLRDAGRPGPDQGAQRLAELVHELSSLLDGSMRTVNLAIASRQGTGPAETARETDEMNRRLRTVRTALEQMAGMLQAASRPESSKAPGPRRRLGLEKLTLHDAVVNGVAILEPLAAEHGVQLHARVDAAVRDLPAGPVYTLVVNGVRNAIESLAALGPRDARGGAQAGRRTEREVKLDVRFEALMDSNGASPAGGGGANACTGHVVLTIGDNGIGPPRPDRMRPGRPGTPGFTTKPGGSGLGLAVCRDLLSRHGGTVSLEGNKGDGATLTARYPLRGGEAR